MKSSFIKNVFPFWTIKIQQIQVLSNWGEENGEEKKDVQKTMEILYKETGSGEAVVLSSSFAFEGE